MKSDFVEWGRNPHTRALVRAYLLAKQQVLAAGYEFEIAWQEMVELDDVTPRTFIREAAWVVLCAGMRESVVRGVFEHLGYAFDLWNPHYIVSNRRRCQREALTIFNHQRKIDAIVQIAVNVANVGVEPILRGLRHDGPTYLTRLPYIGPITCFHLAKNLGCPVAKPDRHLQRIAAILGYQGAASLCGTIAAALDEPIQVVDVVMWRFATIHPKYESWMRHMLSDAPYSTSTWAPDSQFGPS
jgi:hypothetical protein